MISIGSHPMTNGRAAPHLCVVGIQWGDEGKGKVVDVLTARSDVVVRYQGGANAGHTVKVGDREFVLHLVPSGVLQEDKICVIGNGVVVDPCELVAELDTLRASGLEREESVWISERAHVVMPYHRLIDAARERSPDCRTLGTTLRGIGPCYADKVARTGIRMADFVELERFREVLRSNLEAKNRELRELYGEPALDFDEIYTEYAKHAERLEPRVCDISQLLHEESRRGSVILFEGAQGSLLDLDLGTYPYVTSSNTSFLGVGSGTGFSPRRVGTVFGVTKAYTTRVGEGPFPTELPGETGELLRRTGAEFGATTGRPRRCGWLDLVALRQAVQVGDVDALVVTKMDVLDELPEIRVATSYRAGERQIDRLPVRLDDTARPEYATLKGWCCSIKECRRFDDLPREAKAYLQFVADRSGCPIAMVSVGKERSEVIHLDPWLEPAPAEGAPRP
ncbi:MAG: adenylosuccinate synthase [Planctomycetota bacterium]|nr:adenylosuccinate synthase [Planctomycetota bacterium]